MRPARLVHALTDLCLGTLVGVSVGASVAAWTIFSVSREQGFEKHVANTLAGSMFDRLGWPVLALTCVAALGCVLAATRPPSPSVPTRKGRLTWQIMAVAGVLMVICALATQLYFAPKMKDLRERSTWVNGELVDPAEREAFGSAHGMSMLVASVATVLAAGLLVTRRLVIPIENPASRS